MVLSRAALALSLGFALVPPVAQAATATVGVRIADLRVKPDDNAFSRLKLPGGREVSVLEKSADGMWFKVQTRVEKAEDVITFTGWMDASQLKGVDGAALSVAGGAEPSSRKDAWDPGSNTSGDSWGDDSWDDSGSAASSASSSGLDGSAGSPSSDGWDDDSSGSGGGAWESSGGSGSSSSDDGWDF